jgi:hypothetical protein
MGQNFSREVQNRLDGKGISRPFMKPEGSPLSSEECLIEPYPDLQ